MQTVVPILPDIPNTPILTQAQWREGQRQVDTLHLGGQLCQMTQNVANIEVEVIGIKVDRSSDSFHISDSVHQVREWANPCKSVSKGCEPLISHRLV